MCHSNLGKNAAFATCAFSNFYLYIFRNIQTLRSLYFVAADEKVRESNCRFYPKVATHYTPKKKVTPVHNYKFRALKKRLLPTELQLSRASLSFVY